jgi:hypothetical protein
MMNIKPLAAICVFLFITSCKNPMLKKLQDEEKSKGFTAVSGITGVPETAYIGTPLALTGTVEPANAANKTITWTVKAAGTTGANIVDGDKLEVSAKGTAAVTAVIANGKARNEDYTQDFEITARIMPVSGIAGVPDKVFVGVPLTLSGTAEPANATNKAITWSLQNQGSTGAVLNGGVLTVANEGTVTVTAAISGGLESGDYAQNFGISAIADGLSIILNFQPENNGEGLVDTTPIVLNKITNAVQIIEAPAGTSDVSWHIGNIFLGTGNMTVLDAAYFNAGVYTLSCTFFINGMPWLGNVSFTVE